MGNPPDLAAGELATLGKIGAAVGIKGWVRLISYTDPAENILNFRHFYLSPGPRANSGMPEAIEIDECRLQGRHFVGHIRGCDDREQARQYTGRELRVEKSALPELENDEFYWYQLEGLQVINLHDENLGRVHHLLETGANDVMVVRATGESIDGQERLIPYIRDQVVTQVDLEHDIIRVDWEKDY